MTTLWTVLPELMQKNALPWTKKISNSLKVTALERSFYISSIFHTNITFCLRLLFQGCKISQSFEHDFSTKSFQATIHFAFLKGNIKAIHTLSSDNRLQGKKKVQNKLEESTSIISYWPCPKKSCWAILCTQVPLLCHIFMVNTEAPWNKVITPVWVRFLNTKPVHVLMWSSAPSPCSFQIPLHHESSRILSEVFWKWTA